MIWDWHYWETKDKIIAELRIRVIKRGNSQEYSTSRGRLMKKGKIRVVVRNKEVANKKKTRYRTIAKIGYRENKQNHKKYRIWMIRKGKHEIIAKRYCIISKL